MTVSKLEEKLFDTLDGAVVDFYGVDNHVFCIGVNGKKAAFEALEDLSDGYRSYLNTIEVSPLDHIFFSTPIARVLVQHVGTDFTVDGTQEGWRFVDAEDTSHVWLAVGTDYGDQWYPYFVFSYNPKAPK